MIRRTLYEICRQLIWRLVHGYRKLLRGTTFISITGSSGKTTTKNLLHDILSARFRGTCSRSTLNGLSEHCRTVLKTMPWHRFCVLEVAAGGAQSVLRAVTMVPPDMGVMLTIGLEHYTAMRTLENTALAKESLVTTLPQDGVAFINTDDPLVEAMTERIGARVVRFGKQDRANIRISDVSSVWPDRLSFTLHSNGKFFPVKTRFCGEHWVTVITAAMAVGMEMKIPMADILRVVAAHEPSAGRLSPVAMSDGVTYIRDDWKAPFWNINLALDFMKQARAARRIIIMGTISDYAGAASPKYRKVAGIALESADLVIFTGPNARYAVKGGRGGDARLLMIPELDDVIKYLQAHLRSGDLVLLKGSGKTDMLERIIRWHAARCAG